MLSHNKMSGKSTGWLLFFAVWILAGLAAIPTSVFCMSARPSDNETDIMGILLAIFLGPFYWILFFFKRGYCVAGAQ